jgi:hypothetical protein
MNGRRHIYLWGAAAILAGAALRAWFVMHHPAFGGDTLLYGDLAQNMLRHHAYGFTEDNGIRATLIRLPGYPLFLAACFALAGVGNYVAVLWVQVLLDLGTCALLAVLANRIVPAAYARRGGMATLWLAALCPFTANYAGVVLAETATLFSVALAFFALERWHTRWREGKRGAGWALLLGVALAVSVLLRPDQGLLAAAVLPVMLLTVWRSRRGCLAGLSAVALATTVLVLPLMLWGVRNWRVFQVVQPLAPRYANDPGEGVPFGFQRWYRTWAIEFASTFDVYWNYDGANVALETLPSRAFDSARQRAQTAALLDAYNQQDSSSPALDAAFAQLAAQRIAAHPVRYYLWLPVARELNMWLRPRTELLRVPLDWWKFRAHPGASAFALAYTLWNGGYLLLAGAGLWGWRRTGYGGHGLLVAAMLVFVALRCALLLTIDNSEPRYTLECFPVVILLAGLALGLRRASGSQPSSHRSS